MNQNVIKKMNLYAYKVVTNILFIHRKFSSLILETESTVPTLKTLNRS